MMMIEGEPILVSKFYEVFRASTSNKQIVTSFKISTDSYPKKDSKQSYWMPCVISTMRVVSKTHLQFFACISQKVI